MNLSSKGRPTTTTTMRRRAGIRRSGGTSRSVRTLATCWCCCVATSSRSCGSFAPPVATRRSADIGAVVAPLRPRDDVVRARRRPASARWSSARWSSARDDENDDESPLRAFARERVLLGIDPTPEIVAIMTVYFVEGALGLARLAQTFLLKDELRLGPAEMSALTGVFTLPWTVKPLYGFLSDGFPILGSRRKSYLVLGGALGAASYAALGWDFGGVLDENARTAATIAALLLGSAAVALSDVVADGVVVGRTRDATDPAVAGGLQSLCWGSAALGALLSSYYSGALVETIGPQGVFRITAALPLAVAAIALVGMNEEEEPRDDDDATKDESPLDVVRRQTSSLYEAVRNPDVYRPALFLFAWQATPTGEGAFLYFMTNDLGMGPEFLGRVRLVTAAAGLFGVWLYQRFLREVAIKDVLFWSTVVSAPLGLSQLLLVTHVNRQLGIPDGAFVFGDDVVLAVLGQIAFLPTLVLAARICPPGVEAVLFAALMSVNNGAGALGTEIGAALTKVLGVTENNFDQLGTLTIICNLSSLLPLAFIGLLDGVGDASEAELEVTMDFGETAAADDDRDKTTKQEERDASLDVLVVAKQAETLALEEKVETK